LLQEVNRVTPAITKASTMDSFFIVGSFAPSVQIAPRRRTVKINGVYGAFVQNVSTTGSSIFRTMSGPLPPDNAEKRPIIGEGWTERLQAHLASPYFAELRAFLVEARRNHTIHPKGRDIFRAFELTPFDTVKVVILGQDPYHGPGQAHGLCFSVPPGVPAPPSLANIFTELQRDLGLARPPHGDLTHWARQGVLLLNATLTVRADQAASHQGKGWERFTDAAIAALSKERTGLVFMLWGKSAQQKAALIDGDRHYVLQAPHPSPLSAHRGFIGCGHFGLANEILAAQGIAPIDWSLP
jgi:uracil-DNA glycosylase